MRAVRVGDVARVRGVLVPVLVRLDVDGSSSHGLPLSDSTLAQVGPSAPAPLRSGQSAGMIGTPTS